MFVQTLFKTEKYGCLAFFPLAVVLFPTGVGERSSGQSHVTPVFKTQTDTLATELKSTSLLLSSKLCFKKKNPNNHRFEEYFSAHAAEFICKKKKEKKSVEIIVTLSP